ncbi:MAG: DUF4157 domain-containing protein [Reinekea sp.]
MPNTTQTNKTQTAKKPRAQRNKAKEPEQAKTKLARSAYLSKKAQQKLQTKMDVSTPGDAHEQEADRVAEEVSRMPRGVARKASEKQSVAPGSSKPDNHAADEQSLQTKISRVSDDAESASRLAREADETAERQAKPEEQLATKISRAGDDEMADRAATNETAEQAALETGQNENDAADGESAPMVSDETEQQINALKGQGKAMDKSIRKEMEAKMNADFSDVSIHTSGEADALCKQLSARAFTVGNDIFFAAGEYAPDSEAGRKLLAHELTHVVQQESGASRKVYRAEEKTVINTDTRYDGPEGTATNQDVDGAPGAIEIANIHFPNIDEKKNKTGSSDVVIRKGSEKRNTKQITEWSRLTKNGSGLSKTIDEKTAKSWHTGSESNPTYFLRIGKINNDKTNFVIGTKTIIRDRVSRPYWTSKGTIKTYDVDHKKEYQLGGHDLSPDGNLWLLESSCNRSAGATINSKINQGIAEVLGKWNSTSKPDSTTARNTYKVTLKHIHWDQAAGDTDHYEVKDIAEDAKQMEGVYPMGRKAITKAGLSPGEGEFIIYNNSTGGRARKIKIPDSPGETVPFTDPNFIAGFKPTTAKKMSICLNLAISTLLNLKKRFARFLLEILKRTNSAHWN